jgi:O-antigen/teichoic acid export membrane protein
MTTARPSLRRNFSWTLAGNVVYAASLWGILSLLTKLGTPETVGRFSLGSIIATPIIMFSNLQLRSLLASDARGEHSVGEYIGLRLVALPVGLAATLVVARVGYAPEQVLVIGLFALARAVEAGSDILYGYAQKRERLDLVARSMILKGVCSLVLCGSVFALTRSLPWALAALTAAWLVPLLAYDLPRCRALAATVPGDSLRPVLRGAALGRLAWTALPMGLVMLLIQLRNTIPRALLEKHHGEGELGIFAALAYLVIVGTTITLALAQSSLARLSAYHAEGRARAFGRTVGRLVAVGVGLGVGAVLAAWLVGRPLLAFIYRPEYAAHHDLFVLVMAAGGVLFLANLLGAPATASRTFRGQLAVHLVNVAVLAGAGAWLIPARGMTGAALTMLAGGVWVVLGYGILVVLAYRRIAAGAPGAGGGP